MSLVGPFEDPGAGRPGSRTAENLVGHTSRELLTRLGCYPSPSHSSGVLMNRLIYIIGLIVVVIAILSFLGLR